MTVYFVTNHMHGQSSTILKLSMEHSPLTMSFDSLWLRSVFLLQRVVEDV